MERTPKQPSRRLPGSLRTYSLDEPGPDFWSLGIQGNGHRPVVHGSRAEALGGLADILDGLSVVLSERGKRETFRGDSRTGPAEAG